MNDLSLRRITHALGPDNTKMVLALMLIPEDLRADVLVREGDASILWYATLCVKALQEGFVQYGELLKGMHQSSLETIEKLFTVDASWLEVFTTRPQQEEVILICLKALAIL